MCKCKMYTTTNTGYFVMCAFLTLSFSYCLNTTTECLTPKYKYVSGKKLSDFPFKLFYKIGLNSCYKECQAHGGCFSANFDRKHLTCQLLNVKKSDSKLLIKDMDFFHVELPDTSDGRKICGEVSCNNYSTCVVTTFNKTMCIKTDCAEPLPTLTNGKAIIRTNNPISATIGCNIGFTGVGSKNTIHCSPGGRWTLLSYRCEPPVHGNWGSWTGWNSCSRTCGGGTKSRSRSCNNPSPMYGGNYCSGSSIDTVSCNTNSCPIDGGWGSWGGWSSCSKTCDTGSKSRSRSCNNPYPQYGGAGCSGTSQESKSCQKEECGKTGKEEDAASTEEVRETKNESQEDESFSQTKEEFPKVLAYCMSKSAVDQFTRCTAIELAPKQVRVNSVNPGVILTEIHKRGEMEEEAYQKFLERSKTTHALGRPVQVEEVANTIAFLASDNGSFITGVQIPVDGGRNALCLR